jgi:hypothetical protein
LDWTRPRSGCEALQHPDRAPSLRMSFAYTSLNSARQRRTSLPPWNSIAWDVLAALLLAAAAAYVAYRLAISFGYIFFYQVRMPAIVLQACGRGFVEPAIMPAELVAFLWGKTLAFDCNALAGVGEFRPVSAFTQAYLYLAQSVALTWRWMGVAYQGLWPLMAAMHGAFVAGSFALARLFLPRVVAIAVGLLILFSPLAISMLPQLRDYAKAPFIIWATVLLLVVTQRPRSRVLLGAALCLGLVTGIGAGFRGDMLVFLPLAIMVLALAPRQLSIGTRVTALGLFLLVVLTCMMPLLRSDHAGVHGIHIMEGMSEPFVRFLGLAGAPYDLGPRYSDEQTFASIAADLRRTDPDKYDAEEARPDRTSPQSARESMKYLLSWAPLFAADVATRALKSAILLTGFPALFVPPAVSTDPYGPPPLERVRGGLLMDTYVHARQVFGGLWLIPTGLLGVVCLLFSTYVRSRREALWLAVLLGVMFAYPSLQFSGRHFFHHEVWFWIALASICVALMRIREGRGHERHFAIRLGATMLTAAIAFWSLRLVQDYVLKVQVAGLINGPRETIPASIRPAADGRVMLAIAVPEPYQPIITGVPDGLAKSGMSREPPRRVYSASDRFLIGVGGPSCAAGPITLELIYQSTPETWQPLQRQFQLLTSNSERTFVLTSAFYRPTQHFIGFATESGREACVGDVFRLSGASKLPALFSAVLEPNWSRTDWYLPLW